jgi:hypothetical protein
LPILHQCQVDIIKHWMDLAGFQAEWCVVMSI